MTIGDRVRFSEQWLKDTYQLTDEIAFKRGKVVVVRPADIPGSPALVTVKWNDGTTTQSLDRNLEVIT